MNPVRQIKLLHLFIVIMVFLYICSCATTAQIKRTPQSGDPEQGWYSCTLQSKNSEMSVNNYVEIYTHREEGYYYNLYNHDGYFLQFSPERSKLILGNLTEDIQFPDNIDFKKYDDHRYLLEFEKGAIEVQVHDKLSLSVNCNVGKSPPIRKTETRPRYWTLNYSFHSNLESKCQVEENRNQLYPGEEVFSLEDTLDEYPGTFQIPMPIEYGKRFDDYMGVIAYGNKKGGRYQCTELVHRFF